MSRINWLYVILVIVAALIVLFAVRVHRASGQIVAGRAELADQGRLYAQN